MMLHRQHNKRTQKISVVSLSSLLQFQIIKEPCSEEHLVNARCQLSADNSHMTFPEITKVALNQLVELRGIEPRTSCVQGRRSPI